MEKIDKMINGLVKTYNISKISIDKGENFIFFTLFIKNKDSKKSEGIQIKYPKGLIEGLKIDELLRRFEHLIDLKLLESYKMEV